MKIMLYSGYDGYRATLHSDAENYEFTYTGFDKIQHKIMWNKINELAPMNDLLIACVNGDIVYGNGALDLIKEDIFGSLLD